MKKLKLGTYSNEKLGSGMSFIEWSEEDLKNAETYITKIHERIGEIFDKEIYRIENVLKEELRIIPKSKDFAIWYFDNLPIKKQKQAIEITDNDIVKYTKIYLQEFKNIINNSEKGVLKLNYGDKNNLVIEILYSNLYPEKIDNNRDDFNSHFILGDYKKAIQWKGTETGLVNLFSSLKFENENIHEELSKHFINNNGNYFSPKQISV